MEENQPDLSVDSRRVRQVNELPYQILKELGWEWFAGEDDWRYLAPEMMAVTRQEINGYRKACDELYQMYLDAAEYVINNNLWNELNIPPNIIEQIKYTWSQDSHQHLIGRFDVAGGLDGLPIKLIEFNADTPTTLAETSYIQSEMLKINDIDENEQFNNVYVELVDYFKKLKILNPDKEPTLLVSTMGFDEDIINADVVYDAAEEAGFDVEYRDLEDVNFSPDEGIFVELKEERFMKFDFWFKLIPWEFIALEEPELMDILNEIVMDDLAIILNPAFSLLFQSKGMLKILWDMNPGHPLLLETSYKKPENPTNRYVEKVVYGREGENICIYDADGKVLDEREGDYFEFPVIYQDFGELPRDDSGNYYQPGIFYVDDACALSFRRRNSLIIDEDSKFVAHFSID